MTLGHLFVAFWAIAQDKLFDDRISVAELTADIAGDRGRG